MAPNLSPIEFWKGDFGNSYTERMQGEGLIRQREAFFALALRHIGHPVTSLIEFGANRGLNLEAIRRVFHAQGKDLDLSAVEINKTAIAELKKIKGVSVFEGNMLDFPDAGPQYDLSLSMALLMHVHPDDVQSAYRILHHSSRRYIFIAEYYNPKPFTIEFQGRLDVLWKRDFVGEMLDLFPDLTVIDYGFAWRRDPVMPLYDLTWFLIEKKARNFNPTTPIRVQA
jgi:pseudaminic acid biosynthesis-associated methylase